MAGQKIQITLSDKWISVLDKLVKDRDMSRSTIVTLAIEAYVFEQESIEESYKAMEEWEKKEQGEEKRKRESDESK